MTYKIRVKGKVVSEVSTRVQNSGFRVWHLFHFFSFHPYSLLEMYRETGNANTNRSSCQPEKSPQIRWCAAQLTAVLDTLKWDSAGLVVAIAQHANTGAILMQGFADRDAVSATLAARRATFFSRSRQ